MFFSIGLSELRVTGDAVSEQAVEKMMKIIKAPKKIKFLTLKQAFI